MGRIPEATIDEIRNRVDIVDLIGRYVELKKAGRSYKGLCPFHNEKTPSFNVSPDRQIYHCFGCDVGGDVIGFLMSHETLTFPEAARALEWPRKLSPDETAALEKRLRRRINYGGYYIFLAEDGEGPCGIGVLTAEIGKTHSFVFLVALDMNRRVRGIEVLNYRETRGGEIRHS